MDRKQLLEKIIKTLNSLADSDGIARCGLIYELYKLIEMLGDNITEYEKEKNKQISFLEKQLEELNIRLYGTDAVTEHVDLDPRRVNVEEQIPKLQEALMGKKEA